MATVQPPVNLKDWIEENRENFKPPVSNRYLYDGRDFFVMVIKGPNARNDFHLVDSRVFLPTQGRHQSARARGRPDRRSHRP
jgi:3-hydroxyanthranilate 3,4-dioxygenase